MEYLRSYQIHDVDHAIKYLKSRRFSGGKSVVFVSLMGHSYGGALSVFFSAGDVTSHPEAIADISGAELSWGDDGGAWKGPLKEAVRKRKVPIYFLQPRNGKSIAPTIVLSQEAATSGDNQFQATLFPPVITGVSSSDVKATVLPSGDNAGDSSRPTMSVIRWKRTDGRGPRS